MNFRTLLVALLGFAAPAAHAAIIVVNTLADELNNDGDCSLREAVQAANTNVAVDACTAGHNNSTADVILFAVNGEITLTSGLTITQALNITGNGPMLTRIGRLPTSCCFGLITVAMSNPTHDLTLAYLAVHGYDRANDLPGSALQLRQVDRATLSNMVFWNHRNSAIARTPWDYGPASAMNELIVEDSDFLANATYRTAGGGAMILSHIPSIVIRRSRFIENSANFETGVGGIPGGAIRLSDVSNAVITDSLFAFNVATSHSGGAIDASGVAARGTLSINRSTFLGNRSTDPGAALRIGADLDVAVVNTTLVNNQHAIMVLTGGTLQVTHSTLLGPISAAGLIQSAGTTHIRRSLLHKGNAGGTLCMTSGGGTIMSGGFNRYHQGDTSCGSGGSDLPITDPRLLPLEDYGGYVPTLLPRIDSPLIDDAGFNCTDGQNNPVTDDARTFSRPVAASGGLARCDVGAVEWNPAFDDYLFKHGFNY